MIRTPPRPSRALSLLIAVPFIVAACTTSASGDDTVEATVAAAAPAAPETAAAAPDTIEPGTASGTWLDIELIDAATGETFTLASLEGSVVAIEPMAIWCTSCRAQQDNVRSAYADIESAGVHYISLGVDPNEDPAALARYAERRGYGWTFAQSPTEFSRAINDLFGAQILSPPSTPLIVLDASGEVVTQTYGFHGPEALLGILEEAAA